MKKFLLIAVALCITHTIKAQQIEWTNQEQDSLVSLFKQIDALTLFDLKKVQETFIYRSRNQPSEMDRRILIYVEEKLKQIK